MKRYTMTVDNQMEGQLDQIAKNLGISKVEVIRRSVGLMMVASREIGEGNRITVANKQTILKELVLV
jgi:hypothetical protein